MTNCDFAIKKSSLDGKIIISGFKHSAVPILCSVLLTNEKVVIKNLPWVTDVQIILKVLKEMGNVVKYNRKNAIIQIENISDEIPDLVKEVHGTIYLIPAILRRNGYVCFPRKLGGCSIGIRPIMNIAKVLRKMGCKVKVTKEYIEAIKLREPQEVIISLDFNSKWDKFRSGATKTALIYGATSGMKIKILNAYLRPEVIDMICFLNTFGARIKYDIENKLITVEGVSGLHGGEYFICHDYLELLTFIGAVGITNDSRLTIENISNINGFYKEIELCKRMGIRIRVEGDKLVVESPTRGINACDFTTKDISTDVQSILSTILSVAKGTSYVEEVVWERRFRFVSELRKMGAKIYMIKKNVIKIEGIANLTGTIVEGTDVRATAALVIGGLSAEGITIIKNANHLERGYDKLINKLKSVGANIEMIKK